MKKICSIILITLHLSPLAAQTPVLDSLKRELENHPEEDTTRFILLKALCAESYEDPKASKQYADEALALALAIDDAWAISSAHYSQADYYVNITDYEKALDHGLQAARGYEKRSDITGMLGTYQLIAGVYVKLTEYDRAEEYMEKTLALAEVHDRVTDFGVLYNNLGVLCIKQNKFDEAITYLNKSLATFQSTNSVNNQAITLSFIGQAHEAIGQTDEALNDYRKAIFLADASGHANKLHIVSSAHERIAGIYIKRKMLNNAKQHLDTAMLGAQQMGMRGTIVRIYDDLVALHEAGNDYRNALKYERLKNALQDSIFNNEKSQQLAEVQTRYETEKKEQTISLLEKDNSINTLTRNIFGAGLVLAFIIGGLFFYFQRLKSARDRETLKRKDELNKKLVELDQVKSRFFASISHEFRTPLTLILAPLEDELKNRSLSGKERESLTLMKRNAGRLLDLVNQLLDLSKLETGNMKLQVRSGNSDDLLKVIAASFDSWAEHMHVDFIKNIQASHPVLFDADKLEKIVTNLLSNAFKFTPAGGTVVLDAIVQSGPDGDRLQVKVTDSGIGIPEAEQEYIFSPFYQVNRDHDNRREGSGLGLPLVRELVKLYGGTITLQSKVDAGTSFMIELPAGSGQFSPDQIDLAIDTQAPLHSYHPILDEITHIENRTEDAAEDEKHTILIVEDNADLRNFMLSVLSPEFRVYTATDGQEGFHQAVELMPDVVITDLMMPVMDGIELTGKIKTEERTSHIPVVVLTAKDELASRLEGLKTGADDYLTKPFSTEELKVRITNLIQQREMLASKFREKIVVLPALEEGQSLDEKFLGKVFREIESKVDDFTFGVETLANAVRLSRKQLHRKLKAITGLSPNEFIRDVRLRKAADMIRQQSDTISQIGYAVGFNDPSYFAKCFRIKFGVVPSEFLSKEEPGPE